MSKNEEKIVKILLQEKISFVREKTFQDLKNGKFRFDFYLPKENICIEYDGRQHYDNASVKFFSEKESLEDRQYRDSIKNNYCKEKNIILIRIPYKDYNKLDKEYILQKINNKYSDIG